MKILVTGGAGYIGGTVSHALLRAGHSVTIYDNLSHSGREYLPEGAEFFEGDINNGTSLTAALKAGKFDAVMHFAGLIEVGDSVKHPEQYFRTNTVGALTLLESMLAAGCRNLIFSSTAAVYGESETTPILETAALKPTNPYGESKLMIEEMLRWMSSSRGLNYVALRYFNVAGAAADHGETHEPETHIIPLVLDVALGRRENFTIYGNDYPTKDGTCVRDYVDVNDLADAHMLALGALVGSGASVAAGAAMPSPIASNVVQTPSGSAHIYNIGNGQGFTVMEIIESARRVTGHPIPVVIEARREGDPAVLVASSDKIKQELGWNPKHTELDGIIASAWAWHKKRYGVK